MFGSARCSLWRAEGCSVAWTPFMESNFFIKYQIFFSCNFFLQFLVIKTLRWNS
jgi:hypothetical protein